jgi:hypothetical protein
MPKLTRDQQFNLCFGEFMGSTCDLYYPDLKEWSLESLTKNKSSSVHQYQLKVPAKSVIYTIDPHTDPITGILQPGAVVQGDQEIPEIHDFSDKFQEYFDKYIMKSRRVVVSYTSIGSIVKNDNGELSARIIVCYYKSYLPYPSKKKTDEQIRDRCIFLEGENTILTETIYDLNLIKSSQTNKIKVLKKRLMDSTVESILKPREIIDKMERKIKEYYKEPVTVLGAFLAFDMRTQMFKETAGLNYGMLISEINNGMFRILVDPTNDKKIATSIFNKILKKNF